MGRKAAKQLLTPLPFAPGTLFFTEIFKETGCGIQ